MFSAKNAASKIDSSSTTLLSAGSQLQGDLSLQSDSRLDGTICGTVQCSATLTIGPSGLVQGEIKAKKILLYGTVKGLIYASEIEILPTGCVDGDIYADSLCIEAGGRFTGEAHTLSTASRQALLAQDSSKSLPNDNTALAADTNP